MAAAVFRIKICGVTSIEDARSAVGAVETIEVRLAAAVERALHAADGAIEI